MLHGFSGLGAAQSGPPGGPYDLSCGVGPSSAGGCPDGCIDAAMTCQDMEFRLNEAVRIDNSIIWVRYIVPTFLLTSLGAFALSKFRSRKRR